MSPSARSHGSDRAAPEHSQAHRSALCNQQLPACSSARIAGRLHGRARAGLYITKRLLAANGGSLLVRSGYGAVYAGSTDETRTEAEYMPGTLVTLRARTDRPLNINAVYQQLEHDHPDPMSDDD